MLMLLLAVPDALAWKHLGWRWEDDEFPIPWYMDDGVEESLPEGYDLDVIKTSWDNWLDASCASYNPEVATFKTRKDMGLRDISDGYTVFYWNDPNDEAAPGVLGVTYSVPTGFVSRVANGRTYYQIYGSDIIFNDNVDFGTTEDIQAGNCNGETGIEGVATHEIGHMLGLGHSCEQGDACADPSLREATMYWSAGACDLSQADIAEDDILGINALYGPSVGISASIGTGFGTLLSGPVPLAVDFRVDAEEGVDVQAVSWNFGNGDVSTDIAPQYTFETPGQFTVRANVDMETDTCGAYNFAATELGMVTACGAPSAEGGKDSGFFDIQEVDGLKWQTINHTDMSVYGCVDMIFWQVYEGSSADPAKLVDFNGDGEGDTFGAWSPEIQFPKAGTYTVLVNIGGPAGTKADMVTIDVVEASGGCSTAPAELSLAGLGLVAGLSLLRRKRAQ